VSVQQLQLAINSKAELYEATVRNGWYLPSLKSSIVNENYLTNVIKGAYYCPKYSDVRLAACTRPPSKEYLVEQVNRAVHYHKTLATGIDRAH